MSDAVKSDEKEVVDDRFAIRTLSEKTGVNSVTLRAWERRYGLLKPQRTEKGHRLYTQNDVRRVNAIVRWIQQGVAVSKVRALLDNAAQPELNTWVSNEWVQWQSELVQASQAFDIAKVEHLYHQVFSQYPPVVAVHNWLLPSLKKLDQGASKHFCATVLSTCLSARLTALGTQHKGAPTILVTGRNGQCSLWCYLTSAVLNDQGFSCVVMPMMSNMDNINELVGSLKPDGVVVFADGELTLKAEQALAIMQSWQCPVCTIGARFWLDVQSGIDKAVRQDIMVYSEPVDGMLAYSSLLDELYKAE